MQHITNTLLAVARRTDCNFFKRQTTDGSKWHRYDTCYSLRRNLEVLHPHIHENRPGELRSGPLLESLDPNRTVDGRNPAPVDR